MKSLFFIIIATLGWQFAFGQLNNWCGTDDHQREMLMQFPERRAEIEQLMLNQRNQKSSAIDVTFIIPVVVHIIHDNGVGNISYDQVEEAIQVLNEDFRRLNADSTDTRDIFSHVVGRAPFEFRLVKIDPNGQPTDGTDRIDNSTLSWDADTDTRIQTGWPSDRYFNIWVVNSIYNSSSTNGTVLGRAYFPWWGINDEYGLLIRHNSFGRTGTSTDGRTLTHEVGHCMGLLHTFQSSCGDNCTNSGDDVCDTPPSFESTQSCNVGQNSCDNDLNGSVAFTEDMVDMVENYMSYDNCQNMFTHDQVGRMVDVMYNYPTLYGLASEPNLTNTGVTQLYAVNFNPTQRYLCTNTPVTYFDYSDNSQGNWSWIFDGQPQTSNDEFPLVTYATPGYKSTSLFVTSNVGSTTLNNTKSDYLFVSNAVGQEIPFVDDLETPITTDARWYADPYAGDLNWEETTIASNSGNSCLMVNNYLQGDSAEQAILVSQTFDLSNYSSVDISFAVAFAQKQSGDNDRLKVEVSGTCGKIWSSLWLQVGSNLSTAATTTSNFVPAASDWDTLTITGMPSYLMQEATRIKFLFQSGKGNNIYLDDIAITGELDDKPLLITPANYAVLGDSTDVYFDWKSIAPVDAYIFHLDTSSDFSDPLIDTIAYLNESSFNSDTEKYLDALTRGTYFWRVRGMLNDSTNGEWSTSQFELLPERAVELLSPDNYAVLANNAGITLDWAGVMTTNKYIVQLDSAGTFDSSFLISDTLDFIDTLTTNLDTEIDLATIPRDVNMFWRVATVSEDGLDVAWSDTFMFKALAAQASVISPILQDKIRVYPNPCTDYVSIQGMDDVEITDLRGAIVYSHKSTSAVRLDVKGWSPGTYLINGNGVHYKLVVR